MLDSSGFSGLCQVFPLADLTFEANLRQPEILHTEHAVYALQSRIQRSRIFHIALDNFGPGITQCLDCWFAHVARESAHLPPIRQQMLCSRTPLLACNS